MQGRCLGGVFVIFDIVIVLLATTGIICCVRFVYGLMLLPVRGKGCSVSTVIRAEGDCPELQKVYDGAKWLAAQGGFRVVVLDAGMSGETRRIAQRLEKDGSVEIYTVDKWHELMLHGMVGKI